MINLRHGVVTPPHHSGKAGALQCPQDLGKMVFPRASVANMNCNTAPPPFFWENQSGNVEFQIVTFTYRFYCCELSTQTRSFDTLGSMLPGSVPPSGLLVGGKAARRRDHRPRVVRARVGFTWPWARTREIRTRRAEFSSFSDRLGGRPAGRLRLRTGPKMTKSPMDEGVGHMDQGQREARTLGPPAVTCKECGGLSVCSTPDAWARCGEHRATTRWVRTVGTRPGQALGHHRTGGNAGGPRARNSVKNARRTERTPGKSQLLLLLIRTRSRARRVASGFTLSPRTGEQSKDTRARAPAGLQRAKMLLFALRERNGAAAHGEPQGLRAQLHLGFLCRFQTPRPRPCPPPASPPTRVGAILQPSREPSPLQRVTWYGVTACLPVTAAPLTGG